MEEVTVNVQGRRETENATKPWPFSCSPYGGMKLTAGADLSPVVLTPPFR